MTTIAYRNGVMAADTGATINGTILPWVEKLAKGKDGSVHGCCGSLAESRAYLEAVNGGCEPGDAPKPRIVIEHGEEESSFSVLIALPDGEVLLRSAFGCESHGKPPYFAIGAGAGFALGALHAGADAAGAVKAAMAHSNGAHGEVKTVENAKRARETTARRLLDKLPKDVAAFIEDLLDELPRPDGVVIGTDLADGMAVTRVSVVNDELTVEPIRREDFVARHGEEGGKDYDFWTGNQWKPEEIAAAEAGAIVGGGEDETERLVEALDAIQGEDERVEQINRLLAPALYNGEIYRGVNLPQEREQVRHWARQIAEHWGCAKVQAKYDAIHDIVLSCRRSIGGAFHDANGSAPLVTVEIMRLWHADATPAEREAFERQKFAKAKRAYTLGGEHGA